VIVRIESDDAEVAACLADMAAAIEGAGGFVADDLVVRCRHGELSCAVAEQAGVPDRVLVDYPRALAVPLHEVAFVGGPDRLSIDPATAPRDPVQRRLLERWVELAERTGKVDRARARAPEVAISDAAVRRHLADAGYRALASPPAVDAARQVAIRWHAQVGRSSGAVGGAALPTQERWLIPLKHLVNHHPTGAPQRGGTRGVGVVTSASSDDVETFERYGDLDPLQLAVLLGYVDVGAPVVHAVPATVDSVAGPVTVASRRHRATGDDPAPDVPHLDAEAEGLRLRHLSFRPGGRARVVGYLGLAIRARAKVPEAAASAAAEAVVDDLVAATDRYHAELEALLPEPAARTRCERQLAEAADACRAQLAAWGAPGSA
jgi:hypothetical protein